MAPRKNGEDNDKNVLSPRNNQKIQSGKLKLQRRSNCNSSVLETSVFEMGSLNRETMDAILPEALEAAKHVQMARMRQSRSNDTSDEISNLSIERQNTFGKFAISDFRLPLVWNENLCHRYAVFCIVSSGEYCIDTEIIYVDRMMPDISFEKPNILEKVPPDFECRLSVFVADLGSDPNLASVRKRLHRTLRSSFRSAANIKKKLDKTIEFVLGATALFRLADCTGEISSYDLQLEPGNLPFFGHVCCKLVLCPDCLTDVFESPKSIRCNGKKLKIKLTGFKLRLERNDDECAIVDILESCQPKAGPVGKNKLILQSDSTDDLSLEFKSPQEYQRWLSILLQRVLLAKRWKQTVQRPMHLPSVQDPQTPTPHGMALYEATPLNLNRRRIRPIMEVFDNQSETPMSSTTSLMSLGSSYFGNSGSVVSLQPKLKRKGTMSGWSSTRSFLRLSR